MAPCSTCQVNNLEVKCCRICGSESTETERDECISCEDRVERKRHISALQEFGRMLPELLLSFLTHKRYLQENEVEEIQANERTRDDGTQN